MRPLDSFRFTVFNREIEVFGLTEDTWYQDLKSKGVWIEFDVSMLAYLISPDAVCLDVGANIGMVTIPLSMLAPKGHVYAFEGSPETTLALQETVKANGLSNVSVFNTVVGKDREQVKFFDTPEVRSSGHYIPLSLEREVTSLWQDSLKVLTCETNSIDHLVDELGMERVDFIKLDVEGAELDVLAGARETLRRFKPIVMMEFNSYAFAHLREIAPRRALRQILDTFDEVFYFKDRSKELVRLQDTERAREKFLHDNLFGSFLDELLCAFNGAELCKAAQFERAKIADEIERGRSEKDREAIAKEAAFITAIDKLRQEASDKDAAVTAVVAQLQQEAAEKETAYIAAITELRQQAADKDAAYIAAITELRQQAADKDAAVTAVVAQLQQEAAEKETAYIAAITELRQQVAARDAAIAELQGGLRLWLRRLTPRRLRQRLRRLADGDAFAPH